MNELKVCPFPKECKYCEFCWQGNDDKFCCLKGHTGKLDCDGDDFELDENCKAALSRTQPENKPLSLEKLRQMDGEPVWTDRRCGVVRAEPGITRRPGMPAIYFNYGWEWADDVLACGSVYAHKPEMEEK